MGFGYKVYFTERAKNRVVCFDPDLGNARIVAGGGSTGPDADQRLSDPYGLAVDRAGHLIIADKMNHRLMRLTNRLERFSVGSAAGSTAKDQIIAPTGIHREADGSLLLACAENYAIYRLKVTGELERVVGNPPNPHLVISGIEERIPPSGLSRAVVNQPVSAVSGSDGSIFFIERGFQTVRRFRSDRGITSVFSLKNREKFHRPLNPPDEIAIADYHPAFPTTLAVDRTGRVYFGDAVHRCVWQIDEAANVLRCVMRSQRRDLPGDIGGPAAIAFGPDDTCWILDYTDSSVGAYQAGSGAGRKPLTVKCVGVDREGLQCRGVEGAGIVCL